MNEIKVIGNQLFLSYPYLKGRGITDKSLSNWSCRKVSKKVNFDGVTYIAFSSIPLPTRKKLPGEDDLRSQLLVESYNTDITRLYSSMMAARENNYARHFNYIGSNYSMLPEKVREFARKWAVWEWIMNNYRERQRGELRMLFDAYNKLYPGSFSCPQNLSRFLRLCKENGIENTVIDQRTFKSMECRVSSAVKLWIQVVLSDDRKFSYPEIHTKIVKASADAGVKPCSLSWLKKYARKILNNPELYQKRYGADATREQLPSAPLQKALNPNTEWQIDGWTLPFWVNNMERWVIVTVKDSHSRKIVGYSVGKQENTITIMSALDDAIANTGVLPSELVMDKHSFTQTEVFTRFKAETERYGMIWTITTNPRRKNVTERYFQYLDAICKEYAGYLGKGITSKSNNARRSPEAYEKLRRTINQYTPDEVKAIATDAVLTYNKAPLNPLDGTTPEQKYIATPAIHAINISDPQRLTLIEQPTTYKVVSGTITIKRGTRRFIYQLPAALYEQYNNSKVYVRHEDLEQGIYVFEPHTGEIITQLRPVKAAPTSIKDQDTNNAKPIVKNAGKKKSIRVKSAQRFNDALLENPDALEYIKPYAIPKDIRQEATQNRDLKRALADKGVNTNLLPIRKQEMPINISVVKTKESPFYTDTNNDMKVLSMDDICPKED